MKTLEQLGISPTPWYIEKNTGVLCAKSEYYKYPIVDDDGNFENNNDKLLIAAAPELYDMLQSLVEYIDRECIPCGETACELMAAAHNVLAKAAGESEVPK